MLRRLITEMERVSAQLAEIDKVLAQQTIADPRAVRLMTIPGVGSIVASVVLASIGDIARFPSPDKLSSYFGLTPRVRQSGDHPARHGRSSKQGNADARKMLVEALGRPRRHRDRCGPSSTECRKSAAQLPPRSRRRASLP